MAKDDQVRLRHMLDSATEAVELSRGKSRADLDTNRVPVWPWCGSWKLSARRQARLPLAPDSKLPTSLGLRLSASGIG